MLKSEFDNGFFNSEISSDIISENIKFINNAWNSMKTRRRFNYTCSDLVYNAFCCCKFKSNPKKGRLTLYNRYQYYLQGVDKITNEFDAIHYAKTQRQLQILINWLMDTDKRFISQFQYVNTISSLLNQDDDSDNKSVPLLVNKDKSKIQSYKSLLKKFFDDYIQKDLNDNDMRLLYNVYSKDSDDELDENQIDLLRDAIHPDFRIQEEAKIKPKTDRKSTQSRTEPMNDKDP